MVTVQAPDPVVDIPIVLIIEFLRAVGTSVNGDRHRDENNLGGQEISE